MSLLTLLLSCSLSSSYLGRLVGDVDGLGLHSCARLFAHCGTTRCGLRTGGVRKLKVRCNSFEVIRISDGGRYVRDSPFRDSKGCFLLAVPRLSERLYSGLV